ncbi:MAG: helix-turn-helix domain-containing protein [Ruminococcus sp.]|nr:helix-turn-helix domain-containing protein [Ruminococcus sp.]MCM1380791.1 helix-turn-helix domain-containing protein [Muribaculaceae bacterium]MCM1478484.1 helix-turn-helix domain-containing protein [Muribaculaceae bacterium]
MDELLEVGQRISSLRKSHGYTQERLAEMADISVQFLIQIEHGRKTMKVATLRRLSAALSVSADYIINGSDRHSENEEINAILSRLSEENRRQAVKLLAVFADALNKNV